MFRPSKGRIASSTLARLAATVAAFCAILVAVPATPAVAAPGDTDDEGGTAQLRAALDTASRGFIEAKAALDTSKQRQAQLTTEIADIEAKEASSSVGASEIASAAFRTGGFASVSALIEADSPNIFLDRMTTLKAIATRNDKQLREYRRLRTELAESRTALETEIANQQRQLDEMARKKQEAERALASAGGGQPTTAPEGSSSATAKPAARRANGTWPAESCSVDDPTTSGCITPRTLHAMQQAKAAGFTRYVSCHRSGGSGEHPKGRACDFAAQANGFGGVATGADKTYGDNLAAYFVRNADALAVLYVIWFKKIWLPSSGWRTYSGGNGDPSSDHTNHNHLSVN